MSDLLFYFRMYIKSFAFNQASWIAGSQDICNEILINNQIWAY